MYKIIGADQKEYGPVSAEQIRQWIAEGRANGATLAQGEGDTEFTPLSNFPEFGDILGSARPAMSEIPVLPSGPAALPVIGQSAGEELDLGSCFARAWALFQANAGLLIGATAIFVVLIFAVNMVMSRFTNSSVESLFAGDVSARPLLILSIASVPELALSWVLTGGLYTLLLKLVRGQPAGVSDLFAGFGAHFTQLALGGIVVQLLTLLGLLACVLPGIYLWVAWIFTVPLIVDRGLHLWPAMELSRKVVTQHWWLVFCLAIVVAVLRLVGFLACCVGLLVAVPVGLGALIYAYEDIFRGRASAAATPPL